MGSDNGKFFSVTSTTKFFDDIADGFDFFKNNAEVHVESLMDFSITDAWHGADAILGKQLVGNVEQSLVNDIISVQSEVKDLQNAILEKFRLEVDDDFSANIEFDVLSDINDLFELKQEDFTSLARTIESVVSGYQSQFSKYGTIRSVNFNSAINSFLSLCGGDGFLNECIQKLLKFDYETQEMIQGFNLVGKMTDLSRRLDFSQVFLDEMFGRKTDFSKIISAIQWSKFNSKPFEQWEKDVINSFISHFGDITNRGMQIYRDYLNIDWNKISNANLVEETLRNLFNLQRGLKAILSSPEVKSVTNQWNKDIETVAEEYKKNSTVYAWLKKICKEDKTVQDILTQLDFAYGEDGTYHVDVHTYKLPGMDKGFCWQQFGGYMDLYDWVFDAACDMEKDKYVVEVGDESYTFWFWKGDYLNLGYGGECGFYYGDGNKDLAVACATDDEIPMSMHIDYDGDGNIDFSPANNGEETWWITNFNPNAQDDYMGDQQFDAEKMTITYDLDLTDHPEIYEQWKADINNSDNPEEKADYKFENGHVYYTFDGAGNHPD